MEKYYKFLVGGEWRKSEKTKKIKNPYNGKTVGIVYRAGLRDAEDAIKCSQEAFAKTKKMSSYNRAEILENIARKIKERQDEFAEIITYENGKPIKLSRTEVERAISTFSIASEEAKRINGEYLSLDITKTSQDRAGITRRFPIGPVLGITPFNFPLNLVAHKVAPALACGNTIILRPSSQCSITAIKLAEVIMDSEAIPGSINVLPSDTEIGEILVKDPRLKLLTFTGSADVGFHLMKLAGKKKVILELGGNAGVIIHNDADIEFASDRCIVGGFGYAGQVCISVQRIFVHHDIYKKFTDIFLEKVKNTKCGDPMNEETIVGPMIDENALKKTEDWINEAVENKAKILIGGKRKETIFEPTVITNVTPDMKVYSQEIFAPVVTILEYTDFHNAVKEVNNSRYGLQAGIFTNDIKRIWYSFENIEVGGVIINDVPTFRVDHMPYGGVKDSGRGREGIKYAIEDMTELKLLVLNLR